MLSLEKSIELYKLMAERCKSSKFCQNQAQIYSEMIEFISDCEDINDAMGKIRNSKYYLAPSVALMKDKLEAWKCAAIDNEMHELKEIYSKKINEINNDEQEIYTTGYEQTAQNIKNNYLNTMQAFADIFPSYVAYLCSGEETHKSDILKFTNIFTKPSNNFAELSKINSFRNLIPVDDKAYERFVIDISKLINNENIQTFEAISNFDVEDNWEEISNCKEQIIDFGKNNNWNVDYSKEKVKAPDYDSSLSELRYNYEGQV